MLVFAVANPLTVVVPVGAVSPLSVGAFIDPLLTFVAAALLLVHLKYVVFVPDAVALPTVPEVSFE